MRRAIPLILLGFTTGVLLSNALHAPLRAKALEASQQFDELLEITYGWRDSAEWYRNLYEAQRDGRHPFPETAIDFDDLALGTLEAIATEVDTETGRE